MSLYLGNQKVGPSNSPFPSSSNPLMDGLASPGSSISYARGDHVHPSDVSRLDTADAAAPFDVAANYTTGDYTIYSGRLYRFTASHSAGSWVETDATAVNLGDELCDLKSAISHKASIDLGITGSSVGDLIKVAAVDDNNVPTSWERVNTDFELIAQVILQETGVRTVVINEDTEGNPFELTAAQLFYFPHAAVDAANTQITYERRTTNPNSPLRCSYFYIAGVTMNDSGHYSFWYAAARDNWIGRGVHYGGNGSPQHTYTSDGCSRGNGTNNLKFVDQFRIWQNIDLPSGAEFLVYGVRR